MGFPNSNTFVPITDISTRFQVHLLPYKNLENIFAHLGNWKTRKLTWGNRHPVQHGLGQNTWTWVYKRRKVYNWGGSEIGCNFTIMHCHYNPLQRMNRNGVEKGGQMRCGWPRKQLNCPSLSFAPRIVGVTWLTCPSSHPLHFQSLRSVHTQKPSLNRDTTPKNGILRILEMFMLKILAQHKSIFT